MLFDRNVGSALARSSQLAPSAVGGLSTGPIIGSVHGTSIFLLTPFLSERTAQIEPLREEFFFVEVRPKPRVIGVVFERRVVW